MRKLTLRLENESGLFVEEKDFQFIQTHEVLLRLHVRLDEMEKGVVMRPKPAKERIVLAYEKRQLRAVYNHLRKQFLEEHPTCFDCGMPSQIVHHTKGRKDHLLDVSTFQASCNQCERIRHGLGDPRENLPRGFKPLPIPSMTTDE